MSFGSRMRRLFSSGAPSRPADGLTFISYLRAQGAAAPEAVRAALGPMTWAERLSGVEVNGNKARVSFFSDGLTLPLKTEVERFVTEALRLEFPSLAEVTVFFERKNKPQPEANPPEPPRAPPPRHETNPFNPQPIPGIRNVVLVGSGKGGVGKSTVSTNLSVALAQLGLKVGLFDADVYGPNIPTMFGVRGEGMSMENNKVLPPEQFGVKIMSMGLIAPEDVAIIWRGPMITKFIKQAFEDIAWGDLDVLVVDLPPGTGDTQISLAQQIKVAGAVIVTTPQNVALQDAQKAIGMFQKTEIPVFGIVENMASFVCPHCGNESDIFGHHGADRISSKYSLPLLARIPLVGAIREGGDAGHPITARQEGPVAAAFRKLAEDIRGRLDGISQA